MTRKAIKTRSSEAEAIRLHEDFGNTASPPSRTAGAAELRRTQPDRTRLLMLYKPRTDHPDQYSVVRQVCDLTLRVPFSSLETDRKLMSVGCRYGLYCITVHGEFVPDRHLTSPHIAKWLNSVSDDKRTTANYKSKLNILRLGRRPEIHTPRIAPSEPYEASEWRVYDRFARSGISPDATAMIVLAGMLGLRPGEVAGATADRICVQEDRVWMTVPDRDGVLRMVPGFGFAAEWLLAQKNSGAAYLVRPNLKKRSQVPSVVRKRVAKTMPEFENFSIDRARHTWLGHLLRSRIPLTAVYAVAGLTPGSTLPSDLMKYFVAPDDDEIWACMQRSARTSPLGR
jgi:hypothetical protein